MSTPIPAPVSLEPIRSRLDVLEASAVSVLEHGAVGDGVTDDAAAIQAAIDAAGEGGAVVFPRTSVNAYLVSSPLLFESGQTWIGSGGTDVIGTGTEIRLTVAASSVAEPKESVSTTYGFAARGIYFNAQGFGDAGLSLYNCSYSAIDHCAFNSAKAGGCGLLLDSDTSRQCYFNVITGGRFFASGSGGAAVRFTRGANANLVLGGKAGSSYRGMEFLDLSSGNIIIGTDFEENSDRHIYVDAPSNVFHGLHMEACPIGFEITEPGGNTVRTGCTYATTVVTQIIDSSKTGTVLDTRNDDTGTRGELRFGAASFVARYFSTLTALEYDPNLVSESSAAEVRFFLNTSTTGSRRLRLFRGDGTSVNTITLDAATGDATHGDLYQENGAGGGVYRRIVRRVAAPTTGSWSQGDIVFSTAPAAGGSVGWVCVTAGTPGTWKTFGTIAA